MFFLFVLFLLQNIEYQGMPNFVFFILLLYSLLKTTLNFFFQFSRYDKDTMQMKKINTTTRFSGKLNELYRVRNMFWCVHKHSFTLIGKHYGNQRYINLKLIKLIMNCRNNFWNFRLGLPARSSNVHQRMCSRRWVGSLTFHQNIEN